MPVVSWTNYGSTLTLAHFAPDAGIEQQPGYGKEGLPGILQEPGLSPNPGQL